MTIKFTDDELKIIKLVSKAYNDKPISNADPLDASNSDRFSLSAHFVDITCGSFNADVMCNIAGKKGAGKSYSSLEIARMCAYRTAIKLDNDDSKEGLEKYFDVERNVAIMDTEKMIDILTSNEPHQVIIGDDVGTIQGARQYRSEQNQLMNNVYVVNRTLNNIYLSSAPESKHVDRQARDLPEHQMDFQKNPALMSAGFTMAKYFQKITDPKTSESYHQYHYWNNAKVLRVIIPKPPKEMCEQYDKLREEGKNKIQEALKEALAERDAEIDDGIVIRKKSTTQIKADRRISEAQERYDVYRTKGMTDKETCKAVCKELNIPFSTWRGWKAEDKILTTPDSI